MLQGNRSIVSNLVGGIIIGTVTFFTWGYYKSFPPKRVNTNDILKDGGKFIRVGEDGRVIEYFVYGSMKSDARICVVCHGTGGTGYLYKSYQEFDERMKRLNIKVIAPTLPGYGYSEIKEPGYTMGEWPQTDLEPILEQEKVFGEFMICGASGGSLPPQVCLHYFGRNRISAMGLHVPIIPYEIGQQLVKENKDLDLGPYHPDRGCMTYQERNKSPLYTLFLHGIMAIVTRPPFSLMDLNPNAGGKDGLKAFKEDHHKVYQVLKDSMTRAFTHTHHGMVNEMIVEIGIGGGFGFDASCPLIHQCDKVLVWYSQDDKECPYWMGEWLANHFDAKTKILSGHGHFSGLQEDFEGIFIEELSKL